MSRYEWSDTPEQDEPAGSLYEAQDTPAQPIAEAFIEDVPGVGPEADSARPDMIDLEVVMEDDEPDAVVGATPEPALELQADQEDAPAKPVIEPLAVQAETAVIASPPHSELPRDAEPDAILPEADTRTPRVADVSVDITDKADAATVETLEPTEVIAGEAEASQPEAPADDSDQPSARLLDLPPEARIPKRLEAHEPDNEYIQDALELLDECGDEGREIVAEYAMRTNDAALFGDCAEQIADHEARWRLYAKASETGFEDTQNNEAYFAELGEARVVAEEEGDIEAQVGIEASRLRDELALTEPTEQDIESQDNLIRGMAQLLHEHRETEVSLAKRDDIRDLISSLVQGGRAEDAKTKIIPELHDDLQPEAENLVELHRALRGDLSKKELKEEWNEYVKTDEDTLIPQTVVKLCAAQDPRMAMLSLVIDRKMYQKSSELDRYTVEFMQQHMPQHYELWYVRPWRGYPERAEEGRPAKHCAEDVRVLLECDRVSAARLLYNRLSEEAKKPTATPEVKAAQLRSALYMAYDTIWQRSERIAQERVFDLDDVW